MPDAEMDFRTYVAPDYELRRKDELPAKSRPVRESKRQPPNIPYIVPIGKPRLVRPKRKALDFAVGLLLRTPKPAWPKVDRRTPTAGELVHLERNAIAIAKHIGLLGTMLNPDNFGGYDKHIENEHESLLEWFQLALRIQAMFDGPPHATEIGVTSIFVYLTYKRDGSRLMAVRPPFTDSALIYHAAQMIAKGTTSQICEHCGTTFLSGGAGRGKDKKRRGSRFCSDECRWNHHNEMRRKAEEKS